MHKKFTAPLILALCLVIKSNADGQYPPPGKMVDAGGHRIHIYKTGKGGPAVIMESGSGDFSFIWALVQPEVAKFTTAVSYDRAGYAWSEPGPIPRTSRQITMELHTALHNAGIPGPYILVGQSYGGFLVRAFARFYPKEVAGMVLVEALNENARIIIGDKPMRIREWAKGLQAPAPITGGNNDTTITRLEGQKATLDTTIEFPLNKLPDGVQQMQEWAQSQPVYRETGSNEMTWSPEDVQDMYLHKGQAAYMLGDIPLIVLTRGSGGYDGMADSAELENERLQQQEELAHLSTNSKHIIDKNSGHNIHLEDPALVINAIKEVYDAVRLHSKLK
ncbi:MAG TPA: alpha/beta fold hydrolase [Chitinophagaceae bacterium]|nr:alpha/beta fold hydrolase [Chitinophagaceae bacterium]